MVFIQGEEAIEPLDILDEEGEEAAIRYLSDWDYNEGEETKETPWGTSDKVIYLNNYYLSYNEGLGYISLTAPVTKKESDLR